MACEEYLRVRGYDASSQLQVLNGQNEDFLSTAKPPFSSKLQDLYYAASSISPKPQINLLEQADLTIAATNTTSSSIAEASAVIDFPPYNRFVTAVGQFDNTLHFDDSKFNEWLKMLVTMSFVSSVARHPNAYNLGLGSNVLLNNRGSLHNNRLNYQYMARGMQIWRYPRTPRELYDAIMESPWLKALYIAHYYSDSNAADLALTVAKSIKDLHKEYQNYVTKWSKERREDIFDKRDNSGWLWQKWDEVKDAVDPGDRRDPIDVANELVDHINHLFEIVKHARDIGLTTNTGVAEMLLPGAGRGIGAGIGNGIPLQGIDRDWFHDNRGMELWYVLGLANNSEQADAYENDYNNASQTSKNLRDTTFDKRHRPTDVRWDKKSGCVYIRIRNYEAYESVSRVDYSGQISLPVR